MARSTMFSGREFQIPRDAVKVADKLSDAVAYLYTVKSGEHDRPAYMVFYGKQSKPVARYWVVNAATRESRIREYFEARQAHAKRVVENRKSPSGTATRNAQIKRLLESKFGKGKVHVTGDRGTAYGWVRVKIDAPRPAEGKRSVEQMILDAGISLGHYDSGDYGSGYEITVDWAA